MHFTNRIRALAANMLQNVVRQETTRIHVPSPSFQNAQKIKHRIFFTQRQRAQSVPSRSGPNPRTLLRFENKKNRKRPKMHFTNRIRALPANMLQNVVRQETTRIHIPSPSFPNAQKSEHRIFFYTTAACTIGSVKKWPKSPYPPQV